MVRNHSLSSIENAASSAGKGSAFWLSMLAVVVTIFLSALDLTAVGTILPTLTAELDGGDDFSWVGSSYALASTAIRPLSGSLADIWGRKPVMLGSIFFFSLGSALCGSAQSMSWLIGARTVQGVGGGAIINLCDIIISDLVPLSERGMYQGVLGLTWALASGIGPPIAGSLAEKASWRWLFYINLPLTGLAFCLVWLFLNVATPPGSQREKFARLDWTGNLVIIAGSTLAIVGLTFGGVKFPWASAQVLAPLIIGLTLIGVFFYYERNIPRDPTVPWEILSNRTTIGGYIGVFVHGLTSISAIYYLPVYFQAVLGRSPIGSAVDMLVLTLIVAPFALTAGATVQATKRYVPVNALGWVATVVGFGILTLLRADSSVAQWAGYQVLAATGIGILYASPVFGVLAPLPVERNAAALAFLAFTRGFAQTWGITISATIMQNELKHKLPIAFTQMFPDGLEIAYAAIPRINQLEEPLRTEVRVAFADSMSTVWKTMTGVAGIGLLSVLLMREIPLNTRVDQKYGLKDERKVEIEFVDMSGETEVNSAQEVKAGATKSFETTL